MTATVSTISGILKRLYPEKKVEKLMYEDHPWMGMVPKMTSFLGEDAQVSLMYAPTAGGSQDFTRAQTNKGGARYTPFRVTRKQDYSLFSLTTQAIRASANDMGALVRAVKTEGDAAFTTIENSAAWNLFRNGGGARGQIGALPGGNVITLQDPEDVVGYEVGYVFQADVLDGSAGGAPTNPADRATVTAVDRVAGNVTFDALPGTFGVGDYLFRDGDFGGMINGLDAWLPATVTATPFFGVDRTVDETRLGGWRFTLTQVTDSTLTRGFGRACSILKREGSKADCILMNPVDWQKFVNEQTDRTRIEREVYAQGPEGRKIEIGYTSIAFAGAMGLLDVVADPDCPQGLAYIIQKNTWMCASLGGLPSWLDEDGQKMLRESSSDAIEGRLGYFANLWCRAPGWNARVDISDIVDNA